MIQRALTTLALNQRSTFFKPHLMSCSDMGKRAASSLFQGSCCQLNCSSGSPRSLNELPRQLVIRKLAAISGWKARDRTCQLGALFPALITALQAAPFPHGLRNCFLVLVKRTSWWFWWLLCCCCLRDPAREGLAVRYTWLKEQSTGFGGWLAFVWVFFNTNVTEQATTGLILPPHERWFKLSVSLWPW